MSIAPISSISPVDAAKNDLTEEDNRRRSLAKLASIDRIATVQKEADVTDALLHGDDQAAAAVADQLNTDAATAIAVRDTDSNQDAADAASEEAIDQQATNQQAIDLLAVTSGAQNLDAADQASTRSHDLILDDAETDSARGLGDPLDRAPPSLVTCGVRR